MFSHFTPKLIVAVVTVVLSSIGLSALQERTAHADVQFLTCAQIELASQIEYDAILAALEAKVAGQEIRLNRRKTIRIDGIEGFYTDNDCNLTVVVQVTLKRKWLRDVHGTITVRGHITEAKVDCPWLDLSFDNIHVTDVELSHIGEFREWIFRNIANRVLPESSPLNNIPLDGIPEVCP